MMEIIIKIFIKTLNNCLKKIIPADKKIKVSFQIDIMNNQHFMFSKIKEMRVNGYY
jgi:hypothetical protein